MTIQKKERGFGKTSQKTTEMCEDNNNLSTSKKLLSFSSKEVFSSKVNNNNNENHIFVSVDIFKELGEQIKSLQKGQALLRKDLIRAGVLKAA
jgi:hypothetical protein